MKATQSDRRRQKLVPDAGGGHKIWVCGPRAGNVETGKSVRFRRRRNPVRQFGPRRRACFRDVPRYNAAGAIRVGAVDSVAGATGESGIVGPTHSEGTMTGLPPPHGKDGNLRPLLIGDEALRAERVQEARGLPRVPLSSKEISDLVMLATGAFTPLEGFMDRRDYDGVLADMQLASGVLWPIPVTLAVSDEEAARLKAGERIALVDPARDEVLAVMEVKEKYRADRKREARCVFGTDEVQHPGVVTLYEQGETYLAGTPEILSEGEYPARFVEFARPSETRDLFARKGWSTVAAFQTRNPMRTVRTNTSPRWRSRSATDFSSTRSWVG